MHSRIPSVQLVLMHCTLHIWSRHQAQTKSQSENKLSDRRREEEEEEEEEEKKNR